MLAILIYNDRECLTGQEAKIHDLFSAKFTHTLGFSSRPVASIGRLINCHGPVQGTRRRRCLLLMNSGFDNRWIVAEAFFDWSVSYCRNSRPTASQDDFEGMLLFRFEGAAAKGVIRAHSGATYQYETRSKPRRSSSEWTI